MELAALSPPGLARYILGSKARILNDAFFCGPHSQ
jgi:hypothetical protein